MTERIDLAKAVEMLTQAEDILEAYEMEEYRD